MIKVKNNFMMVKKNKKSCYAEILDKVVELYKAV